MLTTSRSLSDRPSPWLTKAAAAPPSASPALETALEMGPSDQMCWTGPATTPAPAAPRPGSEPTRQPRDTTGLEEALQEYRSFSDREYYNADRDAAARQAYYQDIDWSQGGAALFEQLSSKVIGSHTTTLDYRPSKYVYPWVDLHPDGQLRSIYSNTAMSATRAIIEDWEIGQRQRQAENAMVFAQAAFSPEAAATAFAAQEAAALNCEHVVPQSWFSKTQPARGDLHHLFACESRCNSWRGNLPFDELKKANDDWRNQCGAVGPDRTFEPAGGKGPAARATLYFLLRYPGVVGRYNDEDLAMLVDWSQKYPPTLWEKHRNQAIEELQGNRNPLIDFPEMASAIDFRRGLKAS